MAGERACPLHGTKIGIAIPLYDDPNIVNCLSVLMREVNALSDCDFKIVVADSSPHPIDYSKYDVFQDKRVKVIQFPGTIGEARDRAVSALDDREVVMNIDSDCIPMPNWIAGYLELLKKYDVVYGVYHTKGHWLSNMLISLGTAPLGGNMAYKRIVWEKVGGFKLPRYEDTMFLKKARGAGFSFHFEPKISVNHLRPHGLWRTIKDDLIKGGLVWILSKI
ncbi:MAG: glycosyltransferase family A protein [Candidatus Micrarchaeia archaeon]|jgi:hypothetical protein